MIFSLLVVKRTISLHNANIVSVNVKIVNGELKDKKSPLI